MGKCLACSVFDHWIKVNSWVKDKIECGVIVPLVKDGRPAKSGTLCFCGAHPDLSRDAIVDWQYEQVSSVFGLSDCKDLFRQAVKGGGSEYKEINYVNSSSLLAFLCFHDVGNNPIEIELPKVGCLKFNRVSFEEKNKITGGGTSNIDVVLFGPHEYVLFLESKFTEYLFAGRSSKEISATERYLKTFRDVFPLDDIKVGEAKTVLRKGRQKSIFRLQSTEKHYLDGLKQMICHSLALNEADMKKYADKRLLLAEVVYDFGRESDNVLEDYKMLHSKLVKQLEPNSRRVIMVDSVLSYQMIFKSYALNERIRSFYMLKS